MDIQLRENFEASLSNAEKHLKFTEVSARDLSKRIKSVRVRVKGI